MNQRVIQNDRMLLYKENSKMEGCLLPKNARIVPDMAGAGDAPCAITI